MLLLYLNYPNELQNISLSRVWKCDLLQNYAHFICIVTSTLVAVLLIIHNRLALSSRPIQVHLQTGYYKASPRAGPVITEVLSNLMHVPGKWWCQAINVHTLQLDSTDYLLLYHRQIHMECNWYAPLSLNTHIIKGTSRNNLFHRMSFLGSKYVKIAFPPRIPLGSLQRSPSCI